SKATAALQKEDLGKAQAGAAPSSAGAAGVAGRASSGSSLLPTMVRFSPICTGTLTPSICRLILLLRYQPSEPVENSLTSASCSLPSMTTLIAFAVARNCARVMGQVVFFAIGAFSTQRPRNAAVRAPRAT